MARDAEITLEANPDSACDVKALRALRRAGFNRISLGVQSADDGLLRAIGRIHTFAQVQEAVAAVRKAGFKNLSMDLIYGLPGQTMQQWEDTLAAVIALAPEHISCYGLKLEPGTPLYDRRDSECFPDDDAQADMYLYAVTVLAQNGYEQYEISNFAKPGFASRHNLKYWHMEEYAGFGPGAHSDFGGVRYAYVRDLDSYISGRLILSESESDATLTRDYEYVMLSLRTAEGIDRRYFETTYRQRFQPMEDLFVQYERTGLAARTENGWRLTPGLSGVQQHHRGPGGGPGRPENTPGAGPGPAGLSDNLTEKGGCVPPFSAFLLTFFQNRATLSAISKVAMKGTGRASCPREESRRLVQGGRDRDTEHHPGASA